MPDDVPNWTFESTALRPDGTRVHVAITVPTSASWKDVAEIAQISTMHAINLIARSEERCPF